MFTTSLSGFGLFWMSIGFLSLLPLRDMTARTGSNSLILVEIHG